MQPITALLCIVVIWKKTICVIYVIINTLKVNSHITSFDTVPCTVYTICKDFFFGAQCYASAAYVVMLCLSLCVCVSVTIVN